MANPVEPNPIRKAFQQAVESRDKKVVKIDTGELGVDLWCRVLRAKARSTFDQKCADKETGLAFRQNYAANFLAICLCDDKGTLLFPDEFGVIDLQDMGARFLDPILDECHTANGIKTAEELRKNSAATSANGSSIDSPIPLAEPLKS